MTATMKTAMPPAVTNLPPGTVGPDTASLVDKATSDPMTFEPQMTKSGSKTCGPSDIRVEGKCYRCNSPGVFNQATLKCLQPCPSEYTDLPYDVTKCVRLGTSYPRNIVSKDNRNCNYFNADVSGSLCIEKCRDGFTSLNGRICETTATVIKQKNSFDKYQTGVDVKDRSVKTYHNCPSGYTKTGPDDNICINPACASGYIFDSTLRKCVRACSPGYVESGTGDSTKCYETCPQGYVTLPDGMTCRKEQVGGRKKTLRKKRNTGKKASKASRRK